MPKSIVLMCATLSGSTIALTALAPFSTAESNSARSAAMDEVNVMISSVADELETADDATTVDCMMVTGVEANDKAGSKVKGEALGAKMESMFWHEAFGRKLEAKEISAKDMMKLGAFRSAIIEGGLSEREISARRSSTHVGCLELTQSGLDKYWSERNAKSASQ